MFRGRSKGGRGRGHAGYGSVSKIPLKGLFSDGIWQCDCDPRLPAQHFQTKNGGKNHGRWCKQLLTVSTPTRMLMWIIVQSIRVKTLSQSAVTFFFGTMKLKVIKLWESKRYNLIYSSKVEKPPLY